MQFFTALLTAASAATVVLAAPAPLAPIVIASPATSAVATSTLASSSSFPTIHMPVPMQSGIFPSGFKSGFATGTHHHHHHHPVPTGSGVMSMQPVGPLLPTGVSASGVHLSFRPGSPMITSSAV